MTLVSVEEMRSLAPTPQTIAPPERDGGEGLSPPRHIRSYVLRQGRAGAFATCLEWHVAPASDRPGMAGPAPRTRDG